MRTIIYTTFLLFCCIFLSAQQDSLKKRYFTLEFGSHYSWVFKDKYTPPYIIPSIIGLSYPGFKSIPTISFHGGVYFELKLNKTFFIKSGLQYFNIRTIRETSLDSINKYISPENKSLYSLKIINNSNSLTLPFFIGGSFNNFFIYTGINFLFLDINTSYSILYDNSKQYFKQIDFFKTKSKHLSYIFNFGYNFEINKYLFVLNSGLDYNFDQKNILTFLFGIGIKI